MRIKYGRGYRMGRKKVWLGYIVIIFCLVGSMQVFAVQEAAVVRLAPMKLYIGTYRVPYVYETQGEYYVNSSFFYNYYKTGLVVEKAKEDGQPIIEVSRQSYYDFTQPFNNNLQVITTAEIGSTVGKLKPSKHKIRYGYGEDAHEAYEVGESIVLSVKEVQALFGEEYVWDEARNVLCLGTSNPEELKQLKVREDIFYSVVKDLVKANMSQKQILQAFHDYVVLRLEYGYLGDEIGDSWDPVDAYVNKKGVCEAYAKLFKALCERVFIPCELIIGEANGQAHMWNRVYLEDTWLYVDCTFDDPIGNKNTNKAKIQQTYFLKTAEEMYKSHYWKAGDYTMPEYSAEWQMIDGNNIQSSDAYRKYIIAQLVNRKTNFSLKTTKAGCYSGIAFTNYYYEQGTISYTWLSGRYDAATNRYVFEVTY